MDEPNNLSEDAPKSSDRVTLQLHIFQALSIILGLALISFGGYYLYRQHQVQPVYVEINGQMATNFINEDNAARALAQVRTQAATGFPSSAQPQFVESVKIVRFPANAQHPPLELAAEGADELAQKLHVTLRAMAIVVNKVPVVALPTNNDALAALDGVKEHYIAMPPNDPISGEAKIRERVKIVDERVPAAIARAKVDDAVQLLVTAPPAQTYTVCNHDTGWKIARKFHMRFDKFIESNPGVNLNKLAIGDTVNVSVATPPISVLVTKRSDRQEPIRNGAPANGAGMRSLSTLTTYLNGQPQGNPETLSVTTLKRATPSRSVL